MEARNTEFVIFDVETTGLSPKDGDRIIEIAAIKVRNFEVMDKFHSLVNPGRDIPEQAQRVNNITPDMVQNAPGASQILPDFLTFIGGACLCGQNVKFDLDFVCFELSLAGYKMNDNTPALCTIKMAKYFMPHLTTFRLSNLAQAFGIKVGLTHRALADVTLTLEVFKHLVTLAEDQGVVRLSNLLKEFGVQKPVFKLAQHQNTMF
ncbi:MAG: 3'-5' exonuclease [Candidatus Omnitrophota bacterium]